MARAHLKKKKNPLVDVSWPTLTNTQRIIQAVGEFLQYGINLCGAETDATRVKNPVTKNQINTMLSSISKKDSNLRPRIMIPFVVGLTSMKSPCLHIPMTLTN